MSSPAVVFRSLSLILSLSLLSIIIYLPIIEPPFPVLLSSTSLAKDRILVLDTFFHVIIWHGAAIADWRNQGFQNSPEHSEFKALLESPQKEVEVCLAFSRSSPSVVFLGRALSLSLSLSRPCVSPRPFSSSSFFFLSSFLCV
jgi:Gelsolin repeat